MKKIIYGMLSSPVPGHMYPMSSIAQALIANNQEVIYFSLKDSENFLNNLGIPSVPFAETHFPKGSWEKAWKGISESSGPISALRTMKVHKTIAEASCLELPELFKRHAITHLVLDQNQFQGKAIAKHCDLPFVQVTCALPMNRDLAGVIPPTSELWSPANGFFQRLRNKIAHKIIDISLAPITKSTKVLGTVHSIEKSFSDEFTICGLPPSLNWPATNPTSSLLYVGELMGQRPSQSNFPWEKIDSKKKLIYVSLGTIHTELNILMEEIIKALESLNGNEIQFIIAAGKWQGQSGEVRELKNGFITSFAPQLEILKKADLFITHAGVNSAIEGLAAGVPLLMLPITNDQPGMSARAASVNAGIVLTKNAWKAHKIKSALEKMFYEHKTFKSNAVKVSEEIRSLGGAKKASEYIRDWANQK